MSCFSLVILPAISGQESEKLYLIYPFIAVKRRVKFEEPVLPKQGLLYINLQLQIYYSMKFYNSL
ncbi:MAG: hypothetical protein KI786_16060, partial [Mameliella sp.]|nr:hypothetical protein [Phaeodactylibacter sp.]